LLLVASSVSAATRYVWQGSPSPGPPYTNWPTAAHVIQDAVDAAAAGDEIVVTNGNYTPIDVNKSLVLQSVNGSEFTVINGGGANRCASLEGDAVLNGFTLSNGWANTGGGASHGTLNNCALTGNSAGYSGGGADHCTLNNCALTSNSAAFGGGASWAILTNCTLMGNSAEGGGGTYASTLTDCMIISNSASYDGGGAISSTLNKCDITNNWASYIGGGVSYCELNSCTVIDNSAGEHGGGGHGGSLSNCALTGNSADYGGGACDAGLCNCTLFGNWAANSGGGAFGGTLNNCTLTGNSAQRTGGAAGCTLNNCILYYNRTPFSQVDNYDEQSTLNYSCTTPLPTSGVGNVDLDPQLASASHLSAGSLCIGAGSAAHASGTDVDGEIWADPPSIGCDEYWTGSVTGPLEVAVMVSYTNFAVGYLVEFRALIEGRTSASEWDFGDGIVVSNRPCVSHAWMTPGIYPVVLRAWNDDNPVGVSAIVEVQVEVVPVHYAAAGSVSPVWPYDSWQTAACSIQEAADAAGPGALILVTNGVYATGGRLVAGGRTTNRVVVDKPVVVRSVNGPEHTIIRGWGPEGYNGVRCVYLGDSAVLSGFTLTNGATQARQDDYYSWSAENGGGVFCESTNSVVTNCVITGNVASYGDSGGHGGGAYGGTLKNCVLVGNSSSGFGGWGVSGGGGGACSSMLNSCVIYSNQAALGGGASLSTINNCRITDNSTSMYGGGVDYCVVNHCSITGNSAGDGGGAARSTLDNCTVIDNSASGGIYSGCGGGAFGCELNNCTLAANSAVKDGGGAYGAWSGSALNNCTLTGNVADRGSGAYNTELNNSVVYYNTARVGSGGNYDDSCIFNYCCTTPLADGEGNIDLEPRLVDAAHLTTGSPCIAAGSPDYAAGSDVDGEAWANPPSIGCDEYSAGPVAGPLSVEATANYTNVAVGYPVDLYGLIQGRASSNAWEFGDGTGITNHLGVRHAWAAAGIYPVVLTAWNDSHPGGLSATAIVEVVKGIHYVYADSTEPVPPYTSWATAARTIQDAVDVMGPGSLVLVSNGVYAAGGRPVDGATTNRVAVDIEIAVESVNGPEFTVIQGAQAADGTGEGAIRCAYLTRGARLSGFTLTNGTGGIFCESDTAVASNCVIAGNSGGGSTGGTLNNCTITGNSGGGASGGTLNNCVLSSNSGGGAVGAALNNCILSGNSGHGASGGTLNNCLVTANSGVGADSATLNNCTLTGNSGGGVSRCTLNNCIVYYNPARVGYGDNHDGSCTFNFCCTTPLPASGTGNMDLEPQLANASRLSANSPCIGAGSLDYAMGVDIDGEPWADPPSMGCDEYRAGSVTGPLEVHAEVAYTIFSVGYALDCRAWIMGRTTASAWDFGDGAVLSNQPYASHSWTMPGNYPVVLTAWNDSHPEGVSATVMVHVVPHSVHYVAADSTDPVPPYTSWATAAQSIQSAVDVAVPRARVLVADGVYCTGTRELRGHNRLAVDKPLTVSSVNGPDHTIIDGMSAVRCVYLTNNTVLSGFTLTNGTSGVSCESVTAVVSNCVIAGNSGRGSVGGTLYYCTLSDNSGGGAGGGVLNYCTLTDNGYENCYGGGAWGSTLNHCRLLDNFAARGGGAFHSTLNHCTLIGNSTSEGTYNYGGGAYGGTLNNCLLKQNYAGYSGGGACNSTLNTCTLVANSARYDGGGAAVWNIGPWYGWDDDECILRNCILYENSADSLCTLQNCWTTDPLFVNANGWGDLRLQSNSPCINAGNDDYVTTATDLDGMPRIIGGTVDIGAYEFLIPGGYPPVVVTQLQDLRVNIGDTAEFLVVAESPLAMDYQWFFNGGAIADETNATLVLPDVQPAHVGTYAVTVSNLLGSVTSSNAVLTLNHSPIADASATPTLVISPNGANANVALDGSRSSDPDGEPLTYVWLSALNAQPSTSIATGRVAVVSLPVGPNLIELVVDDGMAQDTNTVSITVLTAEQAVQHLIQLVNESDLRQKRPPLASLEAALASFQRGNHNSASGQLHAFQNKVRAQVSKKDAALAIELMEGAAQVIGALGGDKPQCLAAKLHGLKRGHGGKMQLRFTAPESQVYYVEASTNLVDWEAVSVATEQPDGSFVFDDPEVASSSSRFYRIVSP